MGSSYLLRFTLAEEQTDAGLPIAIIDVQLARQLFGERDPIGRSVLWRVRRAEVAQPYVIVGVAPALRHDLFEPMPKSHLYLPYGSHFTTEMYLHVRTAGPETAQLASYVPVRRATHVAPVAALRTE